MIRAPICSVRFTPQWEKMTMRTMIASAALLGALVVAHGTQAQAPNAPQNSPGVSGPVPGSAAPGMPGAPAVGTTAGTGTNAPDGTAGNPPGTAVGRATDRALGTNATGTNPGANAPDGTPGNPPGTAVGRATDRTLGTNATGTNPDGRNAGPAAAGGETNQAVATTNANASQPAHGANSFTMGEAQGRIGNNGFQNVTDLHKDDQGVWRGKATKNGAQVNVWLDYKGNVGQQ